MTSIECPVWIHNQGVCVLFGFLVELAANDATRKALVVVHPFICMVQDVAFVRAVESGHSYYTTLPKTVVVGGTLGRVLEKMNELFPGFVFMTQVQQEKILFSMEKKAEK